MHVLAHTFLTRGAASFSSFFFVTSLSADPTPLAPGRPRRPAMPFGSLDTSNALQPASSAALVSASSLAPAPSLPPAVASPSSESAPALPFCFGALPDAFLRALGTAAACNSIVVAKAGTDCRVGKLTLINKHIYRHVTRLSTYEHAPDKGYGKHAKKCLQALCIVIATLHAALRAPLHWQVGLIASSLASLPARLGSRHRAAPC